MTPGPSTHPRPAAIESSESVGGRRRRWLRRAGLGVGGLLVAVVAAAAVVLGSLDCPWLKRRIQAAVRTAAGLDVDYRSLRVRPLSGLRVEGLVVRTPDEFRRFAPDLVRVERLDAGWSLSSLFGHGPRISRLEVDDLAAAIVEDERGRTSLDALSPPAKKPPHAPKPAAPSAPLSGVLSQALASAPPVAQVRISGVRAALITVAHGAPVERWSLAGLGVEVGTERSAAGWRIRAQAGEPGAPLDLDVVRDAAAGSGAARLRFYLGVAAEPSGVAFATDLRVGEQTLVPVRITEVLHLEVAAAPDPAHGRTDVRVAPLRAADGAVVLDGEVTLPDGPTSVAVLRRANVSADLGRLLRALPAGIVPLSLGDGAVRCRIDGLELGAPPRLAPGGVASVLVDLGELRAPLADGLLSVGAGHLDAQAQAEAGGGLGGRTSVALDGLAFRSRAGASKADRLRVDVDARQAGGAWNGAVRMGLAALDFVGGARVGVRGFELALRGTALELAPAAPLATRGDLELQGKVRSLAVRAPGSRVAAEGVSLALHAPLTGKAPFAADAAIPIARLRLWGARDRLLASGKARLEAAVSDAYPNLVHPAESRGHLHVGAGLGALSASVDAGKRPDAVDFKVGASAPSLAALRALLPPEILEQGKNMWERAALSLRAEGRAEHLASGNPSLRQETELRLDRLAFGRLAADRLVLAVRSDGDAWKQTADVDLQLTRVTADGRAAGDDRLAVKVAVDRKRPSIKARVETDGSAGAAVTASVALDPSSRRIAYDLDGHVDRLSPLGSLLPVVPGLESVDLSRTEMSFAAHGSLAGMVTAVDAQGMPVLAPDPLASAGGDGEIDLRVSGLRARTPDGPIALGALRWNAKLRTEGARRSLDGDLRIEDLHIVHGTQRIDLVRLDDVLRLSAGGDLRTGRAEITDQLALHGLRQNAAPFYPTEEVALALAAERGGDGMIHLKDLRLEDAGAGTRLTVTGGVDLAGERRRLSAQARLEQDLGRLGELPGGGAGRGRVAVALAIESPDLEVLHTRAGLELADVHFRLPAAGVAVESLDAAIPVNLDLALARGGVTLLRDDDVNLYATLRFADQHPLFNRSSYLSIGSLTTPVAAIAPLAGNLKIDQNVVSLGQLEMGVRGGRITGQCVLDWDGPRSKLQAHVRATGVQSSHGEPFDGNAAVVVSAAERSIEGRAEILRIGRRHLLDLLDLQDPHRIDPAINRVRRALSLGYPDKIRIGFEHGFASAAVTFGGLARLVRVDELRGIPTGPLIDKILDPPRQPE